MMLRDLGFNNSMTWLYN